MWRHDRSGPRRSADGIMSKQFSRATSASYLGDHAPQAVIEIVRNRAWSETWIRLWCGGWRRGLGIGIKRGPAQALGPYFLLLFVAQSFV